MGHRAPTVYIVADATPEVKRKVVKTLSIFPGLLSLSAVLFIVVI